MSLERFRFQMSVDGLVELDVLMYASLMYLIYQYESACGEYGIFCYSTLYQFPSRFSVTKKNISITVIGVIFYFICVVSISDWIHLSSLLAMLVYTLYIGFLFSEARACYEIQWRKALLFLLLNISKVIVCFLVTSYFVQKNYN